MSDITAIPPCRGSVIHLHEPDYRPSAKLRSIQRSAALCGYLVNPPGVDLGDALKWTSRTPTVLDPRPPWRWCTNCLGHAVTLTNRSDDIIAALLEPPTTLADTPT